MTQTDAILAHLRTRGPITPLEALDLYGCFRLGARIWDLKRDGHPIEAELIQRNGKMFARYSLPKGQLDFFHGTDSAKGCRGSIEYSSDGMGYRAAGS